MLGRNIVRDWEFLPWTKTQYLDDNLFSRCESTRRRRPTSGSARPTKPACVDGGPPRICRHGAQDDARLAGADGADAVRAGMVTRPRGAMPISRRS
jgi:hypothetical protein